MDLWPSSLSVNFGTFHVATNADGSTILHLTATLTFSTMRGGAMVDFGWHGTPPAHYEVLPGAHVRYYNFRVFVERSDGSWYWGGNTIEFAYTPGSYDISVDVPNGVYAMAQVYAAVPLTNLATGFSGWTTLRVLVTSTGTPV
jgi:hypothetical protein